MFLLSLDGKKTKDVNINQLIVVFMFWPLVPSQKKVWFSKQK